MKLANRIRQIREAHFLTQADIAFKTGISPQAYGKIERKANRASFENLTKIADAIGVSVMFLIDVDNPEFVQQKNNL